MYWITILSSITKCFHIAAKSWLYTLTVFLILTYSSQGSQIHSGGPETEEYTLRYTSGTTKTTIK